MSSEFRGSEGLSAFRAEVQDRSLWTAGLGTHFDVSRALSEGFELTLHGNTIAFRGELMQGVLGYLAMALGQGITLLQCY